MKNVQCLTIIQFQDKDNNKRFMVAENFTKFDGNYNPSEVATQIGQSCFTGLTTPNIDDESTILPENSDIIKLTKNVLESPSLFDPSYFKAVNLFGDAIEEMRHAINLLIKCNYIPSATKLIYSGIEFIVMLSGKSKVGRKGGPPKDEWEKWISKYMELDERLKPGDVFENRHAPIHLHSTGHKKRSARFNNVFLYSLEI